MSLNCPNCGAPIDVETNKCKYCGTSYFDLSCIDFEDCKPVYLKIKVNMNGEPAYITQKVIPRLGEITFNTEYKDVQTTGFPIRVVTGSNMTTNILFEAIQDFNNDSLYTITI